jgi:hypothetical protein
VGTIRPRHQTPVSTYSNRIKEHSLDREHFADVESRLRSLGFTPTPDEVALGDECVEMMRKPKEERQTNVNSLVTSRVRGERRQILVLRYVISRLYEADVDFSRNRRAE